MAELKFERAMLVYQAGIANVFRVDCFNMCNFGRNAIRLIQTSFNGAEYFADGLVAAGVKVGSCYCNECGDISEKVWKEDLENAPFSKDMNPIWNGVENGSDWTPA